MIHVDRKAAPAEWLKSAKKETDANVDAFKAAVKARRKSRSKTSAPLKPEFSFKAYGADDLRDALNETFGYKCAYCETNYGASQPVAVEHFRPKGMITEGKKTLQPGYFWLAADWDNLLPSCTDCNSARYHKDETGTEQLRGKGNHFPLAKKSRRGRRPGSEKRESPLLLHTDEDPETHLEFVTEKDRRGIVRPALIGGAPSERGKASIEFYALDRPELVKRRTEQAMRLESHISNTRFILDLLDGDPGNPKYKAQFDKNIAELKRMLGQQQEYVAMFRAIVRTDLPEHAATLAALSTTATNTAPVTPNSAPATRPAGNPGANTRRRR